MSDVNEGRYDVVWPLAPVTRVGAGHRAERLGTLAGKRVAFLWDYLFHGDLMFEAIRARMSVLAPDVQFVDHSVFGNIHAADENELLLRLPDLLRAEGADAAVVAVGA
jgi:hypothetical protein